jgi:hypothetical protein
MVVLRYHLNSLNGKQSQHTEISRPRPSMLREAL